MKAYIGCNSSLPWSNVAQPGESGQAAGIKPSITRLPRAVTFGPATRGNRTSLSNAALRDQADGRSAAVGATDRRQAPLLPRRQARAPLLPRCTRLLPAPSPEQMQARGWGTESSGKRKALKLAAKAVAVAAVGSSGHHGPQPGKPQP